MKAQPIIDAFGGEYELASLLGVAPSTVYRWGYDRQRGGTGGYIPTQRVSQVLDLAKKKRIKIKIEY